MIDPMMRLAAKVIFGSLRSISPDAEEINFLRRFRPSGLTLFRRNIPESGHTLPTELCHFLRQNFSDQDQEFMIAIDQEGGRVRRLAEPFPDPGPAMLIAQELPEADQKQQIFNWGKKVGAELVRAGIQINFAPCVDVFCSPGHTSIGDRSYSTDPEKVTLRAGAFMHGLHKGGVLSCLKHFPGQGAARSDTHLESCEADIPVDTLFQRDLIPFRKLLQFSPMVMLSHCIYPALDTKEASLSGPVIQGLLRKKLGFQGVVVTDDMTMNAISQKNTDQGELIVESLTQGADLALVCKGLENWQSAIEAVGKEAEKSPAFHASLLKSAERLRAMSRQLKPPHVQGQILV